MSEITKLYENAGIEKELIYFECHRGRSSMRCCPISSDERDEGCCSCFSRDKMKEIYDYPPFTPEKQLELLDFLSKLDLYGEVILRHAFDEYLVKIEIADYGYTLVEAYRNTLEEAIAAVINKRWEYLTEKNKKQIKNILK